MTMLGKKASHAIHALVLMASLPPGATITAADLASHMRLSVSYLESLLKVLRENGHVRSIRGPGGGYELGMPAAQLSLWSVVQAFDVQKAPRSTSGVHQIDVDDLLVSALESHFQDILSSTVIADHVDASRAMPPRSVHPHWGSGFKPLVPQWMPDAPNSVFQLSQFMGMQAAA
jgi:Rrf2 family protein